MITALAKKRDTVAFIFPRQLPKLWDHCPGFHPSLLGACIFFSQPQAGSFAGVAVWRVRTACTSSSVAGHWAAVVWAPKTGLLKQSPYLW